MPVVRPPVFAVLLVLVLIPAAWATGPRDVGDAAPCVGFTVVPGQGPSCPDEGGWWVLLGDGSRVWTHGPDPVPDFTTLPPAPVVDGTDPGPVCAADPATDPHMLLVYTVPVDRPDRYLTMAESVRTMARQANAFLRQEAEQHDVRIDYKVRCDVLGRLDVAHEVLATPSSMDGFSTITTELRARGYTDPLVKYWIWHDDFVSGIGGQGNLAQSNAPSLFNKNNIGPTYAITYGYVSWFIMMHENGHNMGAVQNAAPESSGAGHCNDGSDVMCYGDGGSTSAYRTVCPQLRFDCNRDTYFHPAPEVGSWLYDHWNLASPLNQYVRVEGGCTPRLGAVLDGGMDFGGLVPTEAWEEDLPASCGGRYFLLTGVKAHPFVTRDFDVCFYAGDAPLGCFEAIGAAEAGSVPAGADRARITYTGNGGGAYFLMVN